MLKTAMMRLSQNLTVKLFSMLYFQNIPKFVHSQLL